METIISKIFDYFLDTFTDKITDKIELLGQTVTYKKFFFKRTSV